MKRALRRLARLRGCGELEQKPLGAPRNRLPFRGVLAQLDRPSDRAPSGARGHRVILTRGAAEAVLPTLIGMAVSYKAGWDGHDVQRKVGVITWAEIQRGEVLVEGFLYEKDFPNLADALAELDGRLGMSYEIDEAHVVDMRSQIWILDRVRSFSGAAILLKSHAAYAGTSFGLALGALARPLAIAAATDALQLQGVACD